MATKKKLPAERKQMGRPSLYEERFNPMLLEHAKNGGSLKSFAAKIGIARSTLYEWEKTIPDFSDTIKKAEDLLEQWFETLFKTMASGRLTRVKKEIIKKSEDGKEEVISREYEPTQGNAAAAIFLAKNMVGWRDKKDLQVTGAGGGPIRYADLSESEMKNMIRDALEILGMELVE